MVKLKKENKWKKKKQRLILDCDYVDGNKASNKSVPYDESKTKDNRSFIPFAPACVLNAELISLYMPMHVQPKIENYDY